MAHLNGLSILLAPELAIPKLFQGGNYTLEVSQCVRTRNCTYSSMSTLLEKRDDVKTMRLDEIAYIGETNHCI